ncbi:hypothetical protein ACJ6WE_09060 [Streptomyces sp. MMS24-I31]|uniref:hypothetical protein n=1 Tax=Streptomyces sp. MMS24-I31 TaxID=3351563 RepID=UPI003896B8BB
MPDYSVRVTYKAGRGSETRGYVVAANSETQAKQKGQRAHQQQGEPGTTVIRVTAERL